MFTYRSFEYANCARVACDFLKMFSAYNLDRATLQSVDFPLFLFSLWTYEFIFILFTH